MSDTLKVYTAHYHGNHRDMSDGHTHDCMLLDLTIIHSSEEAALQVAMDAWPKLDPKCWSIDDIAPVTTGIIVTENESYDY